jgi:hypothetical protein
MPPRVRREQLPGPFSTPKRAVYWPNKPFIRKTSRLKVEIRRLLGN